MSPHELYHLSDDERAELATLQTENKARLDALAERGAIIDLAPGLILTAVKRICEALAIDDRVTLDHERNCTKVLGGAEAEVARAEAEQAKAEGRALQVARAIPGEGVGNRAERRHPRL